MAEKIEVVYKPVGGNTVGIYHKYILYTNSAGEEFYARGGPGITTEPGTIITESGSYKEKTVDWDKSRDPGSTATPHPRETIKEGDIEFGWNGSEFIRQK